MPPPPDPTPTQRYTPALNLHPPSPTLTYNALIGISVGAALTALIIITILVDWRNRRLQARRCAHACRVEEGYLADTERLPSRTSLRTYRSHPALEDNYSTFHHAAYGPCDGPCVDDAARSVFYFHSRHHRHHRHGVPDAGVGDSVSTVGQRTDTISSFESSASGSVSRSSSISAPEELVEMRGLQRRNRPGPIVLPPPFSRAETV